MARTQAADYEEKRLSIYEHAASLFAEKGFAAASISDLASRCGISKSLIYHYCASKDKILEDLMTRHLDDILEITADYPLGNDPVASFGALTRDLLRLYEGAAPFQKVLLYEMQTLPQDIAVQLVEKERKIVSSVDTILAAIVGPDSADVSQLRVKTMLYFSMLNWSHSWFKEKGPISRDELADTITDTILKALA